MIDTDKYEGHTEGPWYASEEEMEEGKAWVMWGGEHWVVMDKSDGHLWIEWMKENDIVFFNFITQSIIKRIALSEYLNFPTFVNVRNPL